MSHDPAKWFTKYGGPVAVIISEAESPVLKPDSAPVVKGPVAKGVSGHDIRKQALSVCERADDWLEKLAKDRMAQTGEGYFDAYDRVTKSGLGAEILKSREDAARIIEGQTPIN